MQTVNNPETQSISYLMRRLWRHISTRRRKQFALSLILMIVASFAEIFSIGAAIPFLGILTNPSLVFEHPVAQPIIHTFGITEAKQLLLPCTIAFGLAALLAGAVRLLLLYVSSRLSFGIGADLSFSIYHSTLCQSYETHCSRNSTQLISGTTDKARCAITVINQFLILLSSTLILITILVTLLYLDPVVAASAFGGFGLIYILIILLTRERLAKNSASVATQSTRVLKCLQEGFGGIRDVLIDGTQSIYCKVYGDADRTLRRAESENAFIGNSPRYAMEALGMILIAGLAYLISAQPDGIARAIPMLGALALGAQRLLPVLQQAYGAWTTIRGSQASLRDALELLDQDSDPKANQLEILPLAFTETIRLRNLRFRYFPESPYILERINLTIRKGSRVGFIGVTGSGKSTLIDVIMGLLRPTDGGLEIDNQCITRDNQRAWQCQLAHVPQTIFLSDSSVAENIAFGVDKAEIDMQRVREAAKSAQIADSIESWSQKYDTIVGERGVRLSGGQRQRIGIARALYKRANVIILDEATSALDSQTEEAVMSAIDGLSKDITLLIISHRITTLRNCTQIVELENASVKRICSYSELGREVLND